MSNFYMKTILASLLAIALASPTYAKKDTNNGNDSLPQGKPFQMLAEDIAALEEELRLEIDALQAQVDDLERDVDSLESRMDANEELDALQNQLIEALETAQSLLESRMDDAETSIAALERWRVLQARRISILGRRISLIQSEIDDQGEDIDRLFRMHQTQQRLLASMKRDLYYVKRVNASQTAQISQLESDINAVERTANRTLSALNRGCPTGSSIRQIRNYWGGRLLRAVCERDDLAQAGQFQTSTIGSQTIVLRRGYTRTIRTFCPPGTTPTGGGHYSSRTYLPELSVLTSRRYYNGWELTLRNTGRASFYVRGNVTCGRVI